MIDADPELVAERDTLLAGLGPEPPWWRPWSRRDWRRRRGAIMAIDVSRYGKMLRDLYTADAVHAMASQGSPTISRLRNPLARSGTWAAPVFIDKDKK